jgi:hypothetical protein
MSAHPPSAYEHDDEPIRGLPGVPPVGEVILWQGGPDWAAFAVHALHVRLVCAYFAVMCAAQPIMAGLRAPGDGRALAVATGESFWIAALGLAAVGLLCLFATLVARTTVYTITNRRVVLRIGVAISKAVNLPFAILTGADLRSHPGGEGDLALTLKPGHRASYILLWPHARPFRWSSPQPMLRCVAQASAVGATLAQALQAFTTVAGHEAAATTVPTPAPVTLQLEVAS